MPDNNTNWALTQDSFISGKQALAWEGLFTQGSGYLHIRGSLEESLEDSPQNIEYTRDAMNVSVEKFVDQSTKWGTYIPGVYSPHPVFIYQITNMPFCLGIDLYIDGEKLDPVSSGIQDFRRELDLKTALLTREMVWETKSGPDLILKYRRFIDVVKEKLVIQQVSIIPDSDIELEVKAGIDTDIRTNGYDHFTETDCSSDENGCYCKVKTGGGNSIETITTMTGEGWKGENNKRSCQQINKFTLKAGKELILEKRSAYSTDRDLDKLPAGEVLKRASKLKFDELFKEHSIEWKKRWESSDVKIKGDNESQLEARVSLYHLLRAHVNDSRVAIGAKGFAGDAYWGHLFWDTEIFMLPFFLYTDPKRAKTLTDFRIGCLPQAKKNAREYGYRGARFAWDSDNVGRECVAKSLWQYRDHEIHVTGDVVYGFMHYAKATGDDKYLEKDAAGTIIETCRYWMDRIDTRDGKPAILGVMGPDEYNPLTHNNSFTNRLAILTLELGARLGKLHGIDSREIESWEETAGQLPIPRRSDGLVLQCEDFEMLAEPEFERYWPDRSKPYAAVVHQDRNYRSKSMKQPDVLMIMWLFADEFTKEEIQAAWDYYEPLCTHDSSLSPGVHGLIALRLGIDDKAWKFWKYTAGLDLDIEKGKASQGIHIACSAATWQMLVFGFAGVRPATEKEILTLEPKLPDRWQEISFPLVWKGQKVKITIDHKEVMVENLDTESIRLCLYGTDYLIDPEGKKEIAYKKE